MTADPSLGTVALSAVPAAVSALTVAWAARRALRAEDGYADLVRPLVATAGVFGVFAVAFGVLNPVAPEGLNGSFALTLAVTVPWTVHALRYVGRGELVTRRRVAAATGVVGAAVAGVVAFETGLVTDAAGYAPALELAISLSALAGLGVMFVAAGLVLLSTYRHERLSLAHGAVVVAPVGIMILAIQSTRPETPVLNDALVGVMLVGVGASLAVGVARYDLVSTRPGTGTRGERAAVEGLSDPVFVVDRDGVLARSNAVADDLFGTDDGTPGRLADVVGHDVSTLADRGTVECRTDRGRRLFDPRVLELTNDLGEPVGHTVTLVDVTDREVRRQRIQVLNRILRHNIRNDLDVINAHAETIDDEASARAIREVTADLEGLSTEARRIETLLRRSQDAGADTDEDVESSLSAVVEAAVDDVDAGAATVTVDVPDVSVPVDRKLLGYALRNVVENAVEHAGESPRVDVAGTETADGVRVVVADDGPGIPEAERTVIERSAEDPHAHASSIGLWGTNWAVRTLGGDLSFGDSDLGGAAVRIDLPGG